MTTALNAKRSLSRSCQPVMMNITTCIPAFTTLARDVDIRSDMLMLAATTHNAIVDIIPADPVELHAIYSMQLFNRRLMPLMKQFSSFDLAILSETALVKVVRVNDLR